MLLLSLLLASVAVQQPARAPRPRPALEVRAGRPPPNFLVVLADDVGAFDVEMAPRPGLDALASQGMRFERFYAYPLCSPARYATLFGRYGRRDGIGALVASYFPPGPANPTPGFELISLADLLDNLYSTAIFGKWHLGTNDACSGLDPDLGPYNVCALTPTWHGFERSIAVSLANLDNGPDGGDYTNWLRVDDGVLSRDTRYAEFTRLDAFRQWWQGRSGPKFAYYALNLAHGPYHSPPGFPRPPDPTLSPRQEYERMITAMDGIVGELLEIVDTSDTYVFFFSDNGTPNQVEIQPCPGGVEDCAKHYVYEAGIRVPCIVAGPDVAHGTSSSSLASCVDVMATIADILDMNSPGEDSLSFYDTLKDPLERSRKYLFSEIIEGDRDDKAVVGERYKLILRDGTREHLFDLATGEIEIALDDPDAQVALAQMRAILLDPLDRSLQEE